MNADIVITGARASGKTTRAVQEAATVLTKRDRLTIVAPSMTIARHTDRVVAMATATGEFPDIDLCTVMSPERLEYAMRGCFHECNLVLIEEWDMMTVRQKRAIYEAVSIGPVFPTIVTKTIVTKTIVIPSTYRGPVYTSEGRPSCTTSETHDSIIMRYHL